MSASSAVHAQSLAAYDGVRARISEMWRGNTPGDPQATAPALLALVDGCRRSPLRAFLGKGLLDTVLAELAQRLETWAAWSEVAKAAMGSSPV
ncbi:MAG: hypothetical protein ABIO88_09105 [Burkholderiaceae bacterium]